MDIKTIYQNAKQNLKGYCNLCKECNGIWCQGQVPGFGGCGSGESFKRNYESLKNIRLNLRTIHNAKNPDTSTQLFGHTIDLPVLAAPITGNTYNMGGHLSEEAYQQAVVTGCTNSNTIGMIGDGADPAMYNCGIDAIEKANGNGIAIIKPRANEEIIKRIQQAKEAGCIAVGIDIDGAGLVTMAMHNQPVGPKSLEELKELVNSTDLPFILKGIMTVEEAKMAVEAGVAAIVVSNHGGRILDYTLGAADVLKHIAKEVKGKVTIFADGSVRSGADVLKYIALGADAVLVGRPVIWGAYGNDENPQDGVQAVMDKFKSELYQAMILTGCESIDDIDKSKITNLNK